MTKAKREPDVVLLGGPTPDGKGVNVLRAREDRIETGEVRPVKDGQPITGEMVRLTPREETPGLCDVEVLHDPKKHNAAVTAPATTPSRAHVGPAQVATKAYRDQWTRVFGGKEGGAPPDSRDLN